MGAGDVAGGEELAYEVGGGAGFVDLAVGAVDASEVAVAAVTGEEDDAAGESGFDGGEDVVAVE